MVGYVGAWPMAGLVLVRFAARCMAWHGMPRPNGGHRVMPCYCCGAQLSGLWLRRWSCMARAGGLGDGHAWPKLTVWVLRLQGTGRSSALDGMPLASPTRHGLEPNESKFIQKIVQEISSMLPNRTCLHVANYLVGLESRIKDINMILRIEMVDETRMIGIFGIGGIGKTTIAKEMYNLIADQFERSCFLANVREDSKPDKGGLVQLQENILHDILKDPNIKGTEQIEGILIHLPLEDHKTQLSTLAFAILKNLRIFINRNASFCGRLEYLSHNCSNLKELILDGCETLVEVHDSVEFLDKLVELNFFGCSSLKNLPRSFKLRSLKVLTLTGCTSLEYFPEIECEMEHLKCVPLDSTVIQDLPSSITYLIGLEKLYLRGCKSLVRFPINISSSTEFSSSLRYLTLDDSDGRLRVSHFDPLVEKVSKKLAGWKMHLLSQGGRLILLRHVLFSMPIQLLSWARPPKGRLKLNLDGSSLGNPGPSGGGGILRDGNGKLIFAYSMSFGNLTSIYLGFCVYLTTIPDLSSCSNLEKLIVNRCTNLVEVYHSVGFLDKLVELDFGYCSCLKNLPRTFKLRSLQLLALRGCISIEYFPEIGCEMKHLEKVEIESTVIQELPSSTTYLTGLKKLYLKRCESLVRLPISIFQLEHLETVDVFDCPNFVNFVEEVGAKWTIHAMTFNFSSSLRSLILSGSDIVSLPQCIEEFVGLSQLHLSNCKQLREILQLPPNIEEVHADVCYSLKNFLPESNNLFRTFSSRLRTLNLCGSGIVSLPPCIEGFVGLSKLYLRDCKQLEEILQLPPNIEEVHADGCYYLKNFLP
ncbi:hypothetical protein I3843_15G138800 [Carya illinoinensis]|nr:hypothetical protein I3843_15G138800 [Carya illinoinensis]